MGEIKHFRLGDKDLKIPLNLLGGVRGAPIYCASGRGVCGKVELPLLAVQHPSWGPMSVSMSSRCQALSPAICRDLISVFLLGPNEPERVAALLRGWPTRDMRQNDVGLFAEATAPDSAETSGMVGFVGANGEKLAISCFREAVSKKLSFCTGSVYIFGNIDVSYEFSADFLSKWREIHEGVMRLITSFVTNS